MLFMATAATAWRAAPDSVDRVTLRHEDSPLRDRIRISQWILFDSVLSRFAFHHRRVNAVISQGVMAVSVMAIFCIALISPLASLLDGASVGPAETASLATVLFLALVLGVIAVVLRTAKAEFHLAQHYGRQVLTFDSDFGGFLPRAEKDRVERVVNTSRVGPEGPADA
jgi:hypothetical protein